MTISPELVEHLESGITTVARCWAVVRADGVTLGFTDHDRDLSFEGVTFKADTGLTARALETSTGLAIDNTEALGALSDASITEADIEAGRYDGAEVVAWLVNWADPTQRFTQFHGSLGEIARVAGGFRAELVGLADALNRPQGRVYQAPCAAVLGDASCGVDTAGANVSATVTVTAVEDDKLFTVTGLDAFDARWFERGMVTVLSGAAAGLVGIIKNDRSDEDGRVLEIWEALRAAVVVGDTLRVVAGCDKRAETCRLKFDNLVNFQGFPSIPGEDRLISFPVQTGTVTGGGK